MSAVLRTSDAGDPVVTPSYYVPVVGLYFEASNQQLVVDKIKNLIDAEKRETPKPTVRIHELTRLIELRTHFYEEGQKRRLLTIALCIVAVVAFPHSAAVAIFAGTFIAVTLFCYVSFKRLIAAQAKVVEGLQGQTTFGEEILKGLRIQ
ncbi:MAG TPA: hypothetical protein VLG76_06960 [Rhabdochlamydiaceae bacterium]|nr:hypothetical protein [Rhabdochlamydiaceae bacterium]